MMSPPVGVVVPTRNSSRTLQACLQSLRDQSLRPTIVVVDNHSTDGTLDIAHQLADVVDVAGPERSAQRNRGAALLGDVEVVGFIDSDMVVEPLVVEQAVVALRAHGGAVVVPEHTVGRGFVAKVRAFERAQYVGSSTVEAARFFRREVFAAVGGFDEDLHAGEDWDLALRVAAAGTPVGRTSGCIWHDEGYVGYLAHCAKKGRYAIGLRQFLCKHGEAGRSVLLDRPYLRRPWSLLRHPILGSGLVLLKGGEAAAVSATLLRARLVGRDIQPPDDSTGTPGLSTPTTLEAP